MRPVDIGAENWAGVRASFAESFFDRLFGVRARWSEEVLLIQTRSVHTFGLGRTLSLVAIDNRMTVVGHRVLKPNRLAYFSKARFVMELPDGAAGPKIGSSIRIEDA